MGEKKKQAYMNKLTTESNCKCKLDGPLLAQEVNWGQRSIFFNFMPFSRLINFVRQRKKTEKKKKKKKKTWWEVVHKP